jgi:hypothetical protein
VATFDAANQRLRVWVIAKGQYLTPKATGWVNRDICVEHLHWLRELVQGAIRLFWDCYNAHRHADVRVEGVKLGIECESFLPGSTDDKGVYDGN